MIPSSNAILRADWPAPKNIHALSTTRHQGSSQAPYEHNNLALHVGDIEANVTANRAALRALLSLRREPIWLQQTHSTTCITVEKDTTRFADAAITQTLNTPLAIMTADCLPIVLCNQAGSEIAAIHAGWRGLANGIIENTLIKMHSASETLLAWIGPAICERCYETSAEVENTFVTRYPFTQAGFKKNEGHLYANLPYIAQLVLQAHGVRATYLSNACTFERHMDFYSYRRATQTGRIATLIWFTGEE